MYDKLFTNISPTQKIDRDLAFYDIDNGQYLSFKDETVVTELPEDAIVTKVYEYTTEDGQKLTGEAAARANVRAIKEAESPVPLDYKEYYERTQPIIAELNEIKDSYVAALLLDDEETATELKSDYQSALSELQTAATALIKE